MNLLSIECVTTSTNLVQATIPLSSLVTCSFKA